MLPSAEAVPEAIEEVRDGLGYQFLTQDRSPDPVLREVLRGTTPLRASTMAGRWLTQGATIVNFYPRLKDDRLRDDEREDVMDELFLTAMAMPGMAGGWRLVPVPEEENY